MVFLTKLFSQFYSHVKTHIREEYVEVEKLSDSQLVMQHFRNYDLDKDGSIDGLEIMKAAHKMNGELLL